MTPKTPELYIAINPDDQVLGMDPKCIDLMKYLNSLHEDMEGTTIYHCKPVYEGKTTFEWDPT